MAQEAIEAATTVAAYKNIGLLCLGFLIKLFWGDSKWPTVVAGSLMAFGLYFMISEYCPEKYQSAVSILAGMLSINLISTIFKVFKVNEEGLVESCRMWWRSDGK